MCAAYCFIRNTSSLHFRLNYRLFVAVGGESDQFIRELVRIVKNRSDQNTILFLAFVEATKMPFCVKLDTRKNILL